MKKTLTYLILLSLPVMMSLPSCSGSGEKAKLGRLDSLAGALQQLDRGLTSLNRDEISSTYVKAKESLQQLHGVFQQNPLAVSEELLLQAEQLTINLNRLVADIDNTAKEIQFSLLQVAEWKALLQKGKIAEEDFLQYMRSQAEAVKSLDQIIQVKKQEWEKYQQTLNRLTPEISKLTRK